MTKNLLKDEFCSFERNKHSLDGDFAGFEESFYDYEYTFVMVGQRKDGHEVYTQMTPGVLWFWQRY